MGKYRQGHGLLLLKIREDRIIILTSRRAGGGSNCAQTRIFGGKICNQPLTAVPDVKRTKARFVV